MSKIVVRCFWLSESGILLCLIFVPCLEMLIIIDHEIVTANVEIEVLLSLPDAIVLFYVVKLGIVL